MKSKVQPEFGLVTLLLENFLESESVEFSSKILMILKKLLDYFSDIVLPQYKENDKFPIAIAHYIKNTKVEDFTADSFILLKVVFDREAFVTVMGDKEFVESLFNTLSIINSSEYMDAICDILIECHKYEIEQSKDVEETQVINLVATHKNGMNFIETLIHVLNRGVKIDASGVQVLTGLVQRDDTYSKFFHNDVVLLIEIIVRDVEKTLSHDQEYRLLELLCILLARKKSDVKSPMGDTEYKLARDMAGRLEELELWSERTEETKGMLENIKALSI